MGHAAHAVAVDAVLYVWLGQGTQPPAARLYQFSALQASHALLPTLLAKVPTAQRPHAVAALVAENVATGHAAQKALEALKVPGAQATHSPDLLRS
jgi:hypothetical protein